MLIETISGINPVSTSAVSLSSTEYHCQIEILQLVKTLQ